MYKIGKSQPKIVPETNMVLCKLLNSKFMKLKKNYIICLLFDYSIFFFLLLSFLFFFPHFSIYLNMKYHFP